MQFKHPEILWALFLLLIPIIVHLFQLRKFQKTPFTNVKFLKEVAIQTRKSSQLKKWLTLLMRLLALASIIIAFAQPYFANRDILTTHKETVIYLDNSFSMQAKGEKGELLMRAVNDIIQNIPEEEQFTLFTNTKTYRNTNIKSIRNDLLQLEYSPNQIPIEDVIIKGKNSFSKVDNSIKNFIAISDFQNSIVSTINDTLLNTHLVQLKPIKTDNIFIDSLYINKKDPVNIQISVIVKNIGDHISNLPVSLFNNDELIAKTSINFEDSNTATANFTIPSNQEINGLVSIDDNSLQFDNQLFFNINKQEKINVLAINDADDDFIKRIFTNDEFQLVSTSFNTIDYNIFTDQNLIILNELKSIPNSLSTVLKSFKDEGGSILIIPSSETNLLSYNQLLINLKLPQFNIKVAQEKKITTINFSHPIFNGVFDKQINNFQYPKINSFYDLKGNASNILKLEDGKPFLVGNNSSFLFTAPLNNENSNFKNSPLIVPSIYNIGKNSLKLPKLYYVVDEENIFDIKTKLSSNEILMIRNNDSEFIPLQQTFSNSVKIITNEDPKQAGVYNINAKDKIIQSISYNFNRTESNLQSVSLSNNEGITISNSISQLFDDIKSQNNVSELWKWFVIFAFIFLVFEMLILKFFK